jgi:hypothetical protein
VHDVLPWLYLINAVLLITHEIDSAFWKEWELFKLPGGSTGFILLHVPLVFIILLGLVLVFQHSFAGLVISLILGAGGIFAFTIHSIFINRGRKEFRVPVSIALLIANLAFSLSQISCTIYLIFN